MKKLYYFIVSLILLSSSCTRDDLGTQIEVAEGELVSLSITINDAALTRSGMSQSQEKAINNVFVLVFDKIGTKVSQSYFSSNITSNLQHVASRSGNNMSVYVIANLSQQNTGMSSVSNYFDNIFTVSELNQAMLYDLADDLNINRDLVMYSSVTGLTISPVATQNVSVTLNYAVAKVTLYVVKALTTPSDSYNLTNWTVTNYPQKSNLYPQATDAGTSASDFANSITSIAWVDTTLVISGVSTPAKYAFLYMYENRRGTNSNTTETQKAGNAPTHATAIVLQGYYKTNATSTVTGVTTTIYLGNNGINDYNVNRGNEYSYIATIKGINQINVDSRVTSNTFGYQVNVNNTTLDCHPDWRPLQINSWPGTATINIYNSDGVTPCTWLHVSTINLNQFVNNARPTYNPATDMVNTLSLTFLPNSPQAIASQMVYLYADENTTTLSRDAIVSVTSTEGLTNSQIITVPVTQKGYQSMGTVGMRPYTTSGGVVLSKDYTLVVENIEEASLNLTPGATAGSEAISTMQWGYNLSVTEPTTTISQNYYSRMGLQNTQSLVYGTTSGLTSVLLPAFGRASASSASVASVTIPQNSMNPIFNTNSARYCFEKNRDLDGDGLVSNPNTKGVNEINWYMPATDELYQIYVGQYALTNPLPTTGPSYFASTELYASSNTVLVISPSSGASGGAGKSAFANVRCVRQIPNPNYATKPTSPYVEPSSAIVNNQQFNTAALRTSPCGNPTPIHNWTGSINQQISPLFRVAKATCLLNGTTGANSMTWAQACGWTATSNTNSSVTAVIASPATGCNAYSETGFPAGTWRLPTQREIYIIQALRPELNMYSASSGYSDLPSGGHWTSTTYNSTGSFSFGTYSNAIGVGSNTANNYVRCVHDM